ncbi:Pre-mRNA-splicing factor of RES complex-domain-containing protein [Lineolata rhizophorae]|uniref:Pre-mRNA-splicing factor of RES complex-domain-containing protein n=1 Tax=Lineolata rhizophorae TaxID=578093 RepID=A0A6A6P1L0_9PEZI|nr:Pre-mRNA-splicing factor of RES complex-domain-containing protein [Lineolata rhizophorae]
MSLADYLAKNYLNADGPGPSEKKSKKRKRKAAAAEEGGLIIADDDAPGWNTGSGTKDDDDDPSSAIISGHTAEFRKAKTNNWKTVGSTAPSNTEQAAADAVLASAAAENAARAAAEDDGPEVVGGIQEDDDDDDAQVMDSGAKAGLQSAADVAAQVRRKREAERRAFEAQGGAATGKGQETIYRDASGRVVNVAMKRAEQRRKAEEEEQKKREQEEQAKGDVQRLEKEKRRQDLKEARTLTVARYADDVELNRELKERERWNDPAAGFLAKKERKSATGRPLYAGPAAPNRYGIRPGHRWDGVDRSNGFEREYFKAQNERRAVQDLKYAWEMDE